jgi:hypothetical protein
MNVDAFYDTGAICVKESKDLHSPLGTLYFTRYASIDEVKAVIEDKRREIQSVVGSIPGLCDTSFGESTSPPLTWFADNIDTLEFLTDSKKETA